MRFNFFSKSLSKNQPQPKTRKQTVIQTLEPRRLMSLTAGVDFPPSASASIQMTHSFGFENLLPPPPFASGSAAEVRPSMFGMQRDPELATIQIADASTGTTVPTTAPATPVTLSEMYSHSGESTVAWIDQANSSYSDTTNTIDESYIGANTSPTNNNPALMMFIGSQADKTTQQNFSPTGFAMPEPAGKPAPATPSLMYELATPRLSPQQVQTELDRISQFANEVISQLGRDLSIDFAHIESDAGAMSQQLVNSLEGWRSAAALTATVIGAAVLVQSESKKDKPKNTNVFSMELIKSTESPVFH